MIICHETKEFFQKKDNISDYVIKTIYIATLKLTLVSSDLAISQLEEKKKRRDVKRAGRGC